MKLMIQLCLQVIINLKHADALVQLVDQSSGLLHLATYNTVGKELKIHNSKKIKQA